jgi:putative transposase
MPRRKVVFQKGECYHLYNRGNNSQKIFLIEENYHFFLDQLSKFLPADEVDMQAFSLLPNHYHLSLQLIEPFDVSNAMKDFLSKYVRAFNRQHRRHGHGFEDRFKAVRVESNEYQDYLTRYIHRNPLEARLVAEIQDWEYSSYRCYLDGTRSVYNQHADKEPSDRGRAWSSPAINPFQTLGRFRSSADYEAFVLCNWERSPWQIENGLWRPQK